MTLPAHQLQPVCSPIPPVGFEHRPDGGVSSRLRSATRIIHDQTKTASRSRGVLHCGSYSMGICWPSMPERVMYDRVRGLLKLGAGFGPRPFAADGRGANPCVAIDFQSLRECRLKCFAKADPAHFSVSVRYVHKRSGGLVVNVQFPVGEIRNV
jgi:hypothetical protein